MPAQESLKVFDAFTMETSDGKKAERNLKLTACTIRKGMYLTAEANSQAKPLASIRLIYVIRTGHENLEPC